MKGLGTGVKSRKRKPYVGWFARCGRLKKRTRSSFRRDIPDDLLPEILKRLPLKSLCRFKCVSKSWRSTIITNFLQSERQYLVCEHYNSRPLIFDDNSESSWVVNLYSINGHGLTTPICTPLPLDYSAIRTRYCNGLLCFRDWDRGFFCILNPLTREKICLPENQKQRYLEFGFHPLTKKYKVWGWVNFPHCEIYTLGTTSWRPVTSLPVDGCGRFSTVSFCFNGTFYTYTTTNMIISFDLGSESWGAIQGPKRVTNVSDKKGSKVLFLFELEGCLCLADVHHWKNVLDLWMLKDLSNDSSWVLMATVTESPIGNCMSWTEPYPTRTGEIVLAIDEHRTFYLYSFITQQYDTMEVVALASNSFVTNYVENLVILKDL